MDRPIGLRSQASVTTGIEASPLSTAVSGLSHNAAVSHLKHFADDLVQTFVQLNIYPAALPFISCLNYYYCFVSVISSGLFLI